MGCGCGPRRGARRWWRRRGRPGRQAVKGDGLLAHLVGRSEGHPVGEVFERRAVGVDLALVARLGVETRRRVGPAADRPRYASEVDRVLRACLYAQGIRNDVTEPLIRQTFTGWRIVSLEQVPISSDTRQMMALVTRLEHHRT